MRLLPPRFGICLATAAMVAAACGGSGDKQPPAATSTDAPTALATQSAIHDVNLQRSSDAAMNATSFTATFHADIKSDRQPISEDGTMAFKAPSNFDMKLKILGTQTEILVLLPDEYINVPGKGWYSIGSEVINADAYAQYAKNRGPVDYSGILQSLTSSQQLANEQIDGADYLHYMGTYDLKRVLDKVPSNILQPGAASLTNAVTQTIKPGAMEVWIVPESKLPRRAAIDMSFTAAGTDLSMHMVLDYTGWNEPVDIPAAPADAHPYAELTGGLSPSDLAYEVQFSAWLGRVAKYLKDIRAELEPTESESGSQRLRDFRGQLDDDVMQLHAMNVTPHFRPSYDKFDEALAQMQIALGEGQKELDQKGSGNTQKAKKSTDEFARLFPAAVDLFKSESKPNQ